jgi:hypothetical protein
MKQFKLKELVINIDDFKLSDIEKKRIDKLILVFNNQNQIKKFNHIYSELLLKKIYPLTKGIPFCCGKIQHCIELFSSKGAGKKKKECTSCVLLKYCNYNSEKFNLKPITKPQKDLIKFLEERNESLNDWI